MSEQGLQGFISILFGIFTMVCAYKDYEWFMGNQKAKFFVNIFGREGARAFYGVLGFILVVLGLKIGF